MSADASNAKIHSLSTALLAARQHKTPLPTADWAAALPSAEDISAIQRQVVAALSPATPGLPIYWKAGGGARDEARISEAPLPASTVMAGSAEQTADARTLWLPHGGVEAEIAVRLARDISPAEAATLQAEQAWDLVDAMCVSIELTASRWVEGASAPQALRDADLQTHGALILGPWLPVKPGRDWSQQVCTIRIHAGTSARLDLRKVGSHSLVDPAWLLPAWLRHLTRDGQSVAAGTVVTTGSWVGNLPFAQGELAEVAFEGLGRISVQI